MASLLHPRNHTCPVCGLAFNMPVITENTVHLCRPCSTRITIAPGRPQHIVDWSEKAEPLTSASGYIVRGARVDSLIDEASPDQSAFKVTVRHAYASGMRIGDAISLGVRAARQQNPAFEPVFDDALLDLPE